MLLFPDSDPFARPLSATERCYYHHRTNRADPSAPVPFTLTEQPLRMLSLNQPRRATAWQPTAGTRRDRWV